MKYVVKNIQKLSEQVNSFLFWEKTFTNIIINLLKPTFTLAMGEPGSTVFVKLALPLFSYKLNQLF